MLRIMWFSLSLVIDTEPRSRFTIKKDFVYNFQYVLKLEPIIKIRSKFGPKHKKRIYERSFKQAESGG